ncbi:MAG TPA: SIS domain-containing protein [Candidatus Dormibacteraeota bacterium]|jgi:D-sedoheptulose 7-phosphate isomerase|nr:SIS domain-containing protein [Candidatus Dormibacteraeota bacterium]
MQRQLTASIERHFSAVLAAGEAFFEKEAEALATACWGMARRFHAGGRLVIHAPQGAAYSDAQHNAVEYIHPVLVGKRALPAISVRDPRHLDLLCGPGDIAMALSEAGLTVSGETFGVPGADPLVAQEVLETAYHELWELVHVFFEHEGLLAEGCTEEVCVTCGDIALAAAVVRVSGTTALVRTAQGEEEADVSLVSPVAPGDLVMVHGGVALDRVKPIEQFSQEFYPFLTNEAVDVPTVLADVAASVRMKWQEVAGLRRAQDLGVIAETLDAVAERVAAGGRILAFGNGGSATDSADLAADLLDAGVGAMDLAGEPAVVTAIGNDIGFEEVFARQVIALGRAGDVAVGISTSGRSGNIARALHQAHTQGMLTVGLAGYGGGALVGDAAVDHVIATDSTYIPRIQEAQATVYHALVRGLEAAT